MKNNINIFNALNESLEAELIEKRKLNEADNAEKEYKLRKAIKAQLNGSAVKDELLAQYKELTGKDYIEEAEEPVSIETYNVTDGGYRNNADTVYGKLSNGNHYVYFPEMELAYELDTEPSELIDILYWNTNHEEELTDDEYIDKTDKFINQHLVKSIQEGSSLYEELHKRYFGEQESEYIDEASQNIQTLGEVLDKLYNGEYNTDMAEISDNVQGYTGMTYVATTMTDEARKDFASVLSLIVLEAYEDDGELWVKVDAENQEKSDRLIEFVTIASGNVSSVTYDKYFNLDEDYTVGPMNYVAKVKDKNGNIGYLSGDEDSQKFWLEKSSNLANRFEGTESRQAQIRAENNGLEFLGLVKADLSESASNTKWAIWDSDIDEYLEDKEGRKTTKDLQKAKMFDSYKEAMKVQKEIEDEEGLNLGDIAVVKLNKTDDGWVINESALTEGAEDKYMLLSRLKSDCDYFLGNGNRAEKHLWAGSVDAQIAKMKELWNSFSEDEKPEWLSMEDIDTYEAQMKNDFVRGETARKTIEDQLERTRNRIEKIGLDEAELSVGQTYKNQNGVTVRILDIDKDKEGNIQVMYKFSTGDAHTHQEKYVKNMLSNNEYELINEAEFVVTYVPNANQKDQVQTVTVQAINKVEAVNKAREVVGDTAIVSIQPLQEAEAIKSRFNKINESVNIESLADDLASFAANTTDEDYEDYDAYVNKIYNDYLKDLKDPKFVDRVIDLVQTRINNSKPEDVDYKEDVELLNKLKEYRKSFKMNEDEVIQVPAVNVEPDYIINDVTVLEVVDDGDIQSPDIEALITLVDESLKNDYSDKWGKIKILSSKINEGNSFALVDISTPEILKEFEDKGISDIAIGKNLILENVGKLIEFKVNSLNGTTKYCKKTSNPIQTIKEWVESEFLREAKNEKIKELEILKAKTEKDTVENYINNRIDLKQEIANIKMFIQLAKETKAQEEMKPIIRDRMYGFAAEMPNNIEVSNKDDKYELKFNTFDDIVEIVFGKEWIKEKEEIPEVVLKEAALPNISKFIYDLDANKGNAWSAQSYTEDGKGNKIIIVSKNGQSENTAEDIKNAVESKYIKLKGEITENKNGVWFYLTESTKINESYEQFNIGNIEVVFNPETYETLYSIPSADVKDKKINLTKIPSADIPYDTNTIIKSYIETKFGVIPTEQEVKASKEEVPVEEPVNPEVPMEIQEDELPEEPGEEGNVDVGVDLDSIESKEVPEETQAETGDAVFMKIRPNQHSTVEDIRTRNLDGDTPTTNYIVVDTIDLSDEEWNNYLEDLSAPQSFLSGIQPIDRKNYSFNVVKITNANSQFDLLIDPLGYEYSRYIAVLDK